MTTKKVRILWPPKSLYETINTPQAWKAHPGSPLWNYDGQFIWIVKEV